MAVVADFTVMSERLLAKANNCLVDLSNVDRTQKIIDNQGPSTCPKDLGNLTTDIVAPRAGVERDRNRDHHLCNHSWPV